MTHNQSPQSTGRTLAEVFGPLDGAHLHRRKADLLRRAALVTEFGWDQFRYQWSRGEVLGTALVLHDRDEMQRWSEMEDSVLSQWSCDPWGIDGGQRDVDSGCPTTRALFDSIRAELVGKRSIAETTSKG